MVRLATLITPNSLLILSFPGTFKLSLGLDAPKAIPYMLESFSCSYSLCKVLFTIVDRY